MIKSASQSSISNNLKYRSMSAGAVPSSEYLIQTTVVGATPAASVEFDVSDYAGIYKHLQLKIAARSTRAGGDDQITMRFNGDTGSNYAWHRLLGDGSSASSYGLASQSAPQLGAIPAASATSGIFGGLVVDVLDFSSPSKNTTVRSLNGFTSSWIALHSILYNSTSAVTSIEITALQGSLAQYSRFSLYGVTA